MTLPSQLLVADDSHHHQTTEAMNIHTASVGYQKLTPLSRGGISLPREERKLGFSDHNFVAQTRCKSLFISINQAPHTYLQEVFCRSDIISKSNTYAQEEVVLLQQVLEFS